MALYQTTIIGYKKILENTVEVSFKRPSAFSFKAGQYIQVGLPKLLHADYKGSSRVLSIASSPTDKEVISVAFRDTGSGFKQTIKEMNIGSTVKIDGPYGFYTLPEKLSGSIIFIAGGIGIVPFLSMIRYASESKGQLAYPTTLIYLNSNKERAVYLNELKGYGRHLKNFNLKAEFRRIDGQFFSENIEDIPNCIWHIVGPPGMTDSIRSSLYSLGIDQGKIHFEEFTGY